MLVGVHANDHPSRVNHTKSSPHTCERREEGKRGREMVRKRRGEREEERLGKEG